MSRDGLLPTIRAGRVLLRSLDERDLDALFEVFSDPQVMRYWSSGPLADRAAAETLLADIRAKAARRELYQWGVAGVDDDVVVGTCTLLQVDTGNGRAEVGYALAHAQWGRGLMTEALGALIGHAFGELGLRRLEADVDPRNAASIRLLERLGFRHEGLLRERWRVAGELQDTALYGLLARDFRPPGGAGLPSPQARG